MINIKQHALGPFKQNAFSLALDFIKQRPNRIGINQNLRRNLAELLENIRSRNFGLPKPAP